MSNFDHERELPEPFCEFTDPPALGDVQRQDDAQAPRMEPHIADPMAWDAGGWIADHQPELPSALRALAPELWPAIKSLAGAAYMRGRLDQHDMVLAILERSNGTH